MRGLCLLLLVLAIVGSGCGARDDDTAPSATPASSNPNIGPDSWHLAREIARRDPLVAKLLAGRRFTFVPSSDWVDCDGSSIGAVLEIHLADPVDYEGDFPFVTFNHQSGKPYYQTIVHLAVRNARDLLVFVDLRQDRVVGVDPTYSDEVRVLEHEVVKEPEVPDNGLDCEGDPESD